MLPYDSLAPGAERHPYRYFPPPERRPGDEKVGNVHARDQQHTAPRCSCVVRAENRRIRLSGTIPDRRKPRNTRSFPHRPDDSVGHHLRCQCANPGDIRRTCM